jgi:hypothetical protein
MNMPYLFGPAAALFNQLKIITNGGCNPQHRSGKILEGGRA